MNKEKRFTIQSQALEIEALYVIIDEVKSDIDRIWERCRIYGSNIDFILMSLSENDALVERYQNLFMIETKHLNELQEHLCDLEKELKIIEKIEPIRFKQDGFKTVEIKKEKDGKIR